MKSWGFFLIIMAVLSVILPRMGLQFIILVWIDNWGTTIGWVIRAVLLITGIGLVVADGRAGGKPASDPSENPLSQRSDGPHSAIKKTPENER